jgi:hypothetical protein
MEPFQSLLLFLGIVLSWLFYSIIIIFQDSIERKKEDQLSPLKLDSNIKWAYYYFLLAFFYVLMRNFGSQISFSENILPNLSEISFRYTIFFAFAILFLKKTNYWLELISLFLISFISIPLLEFLLSPYGDNTKYYSLFAITIAMLVGNIFLPLEKYSNNDITPLSSANLEYRSRFPSLQTFVYWMISLLFFVLIPLGFTDASPMDVFRKLGIALWVGFGSCLISIFILAIWDRDEKSPFETLISFSMGFIAGMMQSVDSPLIGLVVLVFIVGVFSVFSNYTLTKLKMHPVWIFFTLAGISSCLSMILYPMIQTASILNPNLWNLISIRFYSFFLIAIVISITVWILIGVKLLLEKMIK